MSLLLFGGQQSVYLGKALLLLVWFALWDFYWHSWNLANVIEHFKFNWKKSSWSAAMKSFLEEKTGWRWNGPSTVHPKSWHLLHCNNSEYFVLLLNKLLEKYPSHLHSNLDTTHKPYYNWYCGKGGATGEGKKRDSLLWTVSKWVTMLPDKGLQYKCAGLYLALKFFHCFESYQRHGRKILSTYFIQIFFKKHQFILFIFLGLNHVVITNWKITAERYQPLRFISMVCQFASPPHPTALFFLTFYFNGTF